MTDWLYQRIVDQGFQSETAVYMTNGLLLVGIFLVCVLSYRLTKSVFLRLMKRIVRRSKFTLDDTLMEYKVFHQLVLFVPAGLLYASSALFLGGEDWVKRFAFCLMVFSVLRTVDKLLNAVGAIYTRTEASKTRPIRGLLQVIKIAVYVVGTLIMLSVMLDRSPALLLGGLGAASAVLMLIFQNTILGFVASIQLTENDMVRIGDWIEMPSHLANGDVQEISLHTVKVMNWDKTITTIPTHAMISESFKNWRSMQESGGRRIKRSVYLDMTSVRFCTEEMLERYERIQHIRAYLEARQQEIQSYNDDNGIDGSSLVNGRRLTNLGTFRAYLTAYLASHPRVNQEMTRMVRQLEPTEHGLPVELYVFTNTTNWVEYESIQSDIFDHILAVIPEFDLRIYQNPTGHDFQQTNLMQSL